MERAALDRVGVDQVGFEARRAPCRLPLAPQHRLQSPAQWGGVPLALPAACLSQGQWRDGAATATLPTCPEASPQITPPALWSAGRDDFRGGPIPPPPLPREKPSQLPAAP